MELYSGYIHQPFVPRRTEILSLFVLSAREVAQLDYLRYYLFAREVAQLDYLRYYLFVREVAQLDYLR